MAPAPAVCMPGSIPWLRKAPVVDTDKDDEGGIDIGEDKTPEDDDDDGINIGDPDEDNNNEGTKPTPDQDAQPPQTGDNSSIAFLVVLLIVSLFVLFIISKKAFFEKRLK